MKNLVNKKIRKREAINREWYSSRSILGNDWAIFFLLLGGREIGKSYDVMKLFLNQNKRYKRPFYWLRLTEESQRKLLMNNAEKLIDPDLRRKYKLDIVTKGSNVYNVIERSEPDEKGKTKIIKKELLARVLALSTFYNDKGNGLFDNEFLNNPLMYYNICFDEMNREKNERKSFDIVYAFTNQLENLVRSTKKRIRVICIGNTLEEASDLLCGFEFIPETFGRFYLRKKRAVVDYIENGEKYIARRKGTIADILMPSSSTFTNKVTTDTALIYKRGLENPVAIIKFSKDKSDWFTVWDHSVIKQWNKEKISHIIPMLPYLDEIFNVKERNNIFEVFDNRGFKFRNLITFKLFQKNLELIRPKR